MAKEIENRFALKQSCNRFQSLPFSPASAPKIQRAGQRITLLAD